MRGSGLNVHTFGEVTSWNEFGGGEVVIYYIYCSMHTLWVVDDDDI